MVDRSARATALSALRPLTPGAAFCGLVILAAACLHAHPALAQPEAIATPASAPKIAAPTKPLWSALTPAEQTALRPLAPHWNGISEPHKRKWIALSRNYADMKPEDQATLHSRMTEWAGLSSQQRAQARLNFAEVKRLPVDERKAKWEAYQALSEEEKRKLADSARNTRPASAALSTRPVPARKLAPVPAIPSTLAKGEHAPRIQLAPPLPAVAAVPVLPAATTAPLTAPSPAPASLPPVPPEAQVPAPNSTTAP